MSYLTISFALYFLAQVITSTTDNNSLKVFRVVRAFTNFRPFTCFFCMSIWLSAGTNLFLYLQHYQDIKHALFGFLVVTGMTLFLGRLTGLTR